MNKNSLVLFFLFFHFFLGFSQGKEFQNFTTEEGLSSNEVYSAFQDKNGVVWFATDRGLSTYNGYEFKNYAPKNGLTDITVFDFFPQPNQQIWCSTFNGKLFYFINGSTSFKPYKYNHVFSSYIYRKKIPTFFVRKLKVTQQGDVYISDGSTLLKIDRKGVLTELYRKSAKEQTPCYLNLYPINSLQKIEYFSPRKSVVSLPLKKGLFRNIVSCFKDSKLVICDSLVRFYNSNSKAIDIEYKNYIAIGVGQYDARHFWIGYRGKGYSVFDDKGVKVASFLKANSVTKVLRDCYGGIWVTSVDAGVFYKRPSQIKNFKFQNTRINSLTKNKNNQLFIGGFNGNVYKREKDGSIVKLYNGLMNIPSIVQYNSILNTTFCYSDNKIITFPKNNNYQNIGGVLKMSDDSESLIFARYGIYTVVDKNRIFSDTLHFRIHDISKVSNTFYLGTIDGLKVLHHGKISKLNNDIFKYRIDDIDYVKSKGILYLATLGKGVIVYNIKDGTFFTVDKSKGLSNDIVTELLVENENTIWVCTNKGLNRISFKDKKKFNIDYITTNNGLQSNQIHDVEILEDSVYVGTTKGLSIFSKRQFSELISKKDHFLRIKDIKINNVLYTKSNSNLDLRYNQNQIDFFVEAVSFAPKNTIVYQYKLVGLDKTWKTTNDRRISYEYIPSGNYKLYVKVIDDGRFFPEECATLSFKIQKPFWQTSWFFLLWISFLAVVIYFFFKIKVLTYNKDIVRELLRLWMKRLKKKEGFFLFKEAGKEVRIKTSEILFVQSSGNYIDVITVTKKYTIRGKIGDFMHSVPDALEFLRVHRSYIVRIDKIDQKSKKDIYIKDFIIPVGEKYLTEIEKIHF